MDHAKARGEADADAEVDAGADESGAESGADRPVSALRAFLATEVAGGVVLLAATVVALAWANSPWRAGYEGLWDTVATVGTDRWHVELDFRHWVNDGLMALFFLVVGLEVKRELTQGELSDRRRAALPVVAAIGGMVVPAAVYLAFNAAGEGMRGWGVPMATDIAFALGVLALVAPRLPSSLRVFLLALAIVDDIGAIVVIAVFYAGSIDWRWLAVAAGVVLAVHVTRRISTRFAAVHVLLGCALWVAFHEAGVHPTIAGVLMGVSVASGAQMVRLEHALHPVTSLMIVPVFALANAGVRLDGSQLESAVTSPVTLGILLGLVVGKTAGISGASWLAWRLGLAELSPGVRWRQIVGVAALGGIGFTVSLFVTDLAFTSEALVDDAKVGILAASVLASAVGAAVLRGAPATGAGFAASTPSSRGPASAA